MAKIIVQQSPRVYDFRVNNLQFICQIEFEDEVNIAPIDILLKDLQNCTEQLKKMTQFKQKDEHSKDKKV